MNGSMGGLMRCALDPARAFGARRRSLRSRRFGGGESENRLGKAKTFGQPKPKRSLRFAWVRAVVLGRSAELHSAVSRICNPPGARRPRALGTSNGQPKAIRPACRSLGAGRRYSRLQICATPKQISLCASPRSKTPSRRWEALAGRLARCSWARRKHSDHHRAFASAGLASARGVASQIFTVSSQSAEANRFPSGLNATPETSPFKVSIS